MFECFTLNVCSVCLHAAASCPWVRGHAVHIGNEVRSTRRHSHCSSDPMMHCTVETNLFCLFVCAVFSCKMFLSKHYNLCIYQLEEQLIVVNSVAKELNLCSDLIPLAFSYCVFCLSLLNFRDSDTKWNDLQAASSGDSFLRHWHNGRDSEPHNPVVCTGQPLQTDSVYCSIRCHFA